VSFTWGRTAPPSISRAKIGSEIERAKRSEPIVWANRSADRSLMPTTSAPTLRKESLREGVLRPSVEDFDVRLWGTHEPHRRDWHYRWGPPSASGGRIEFFCGGRAPLASWAAGHRSQHNGIRQTGRTAGSIRRLRASQLKRTAKDLHSRLATHEADALASRAESIGPIRFTFAVIEGSDANSLKQIATAIVTRPGHAAVVLSAPPPAFVVVARSTDVSLDAGALLKRMQFDAPAAGRTVQ
jgi:hypothetical protein